MTAAGYAGHLPALLLGQLREVLHLEAAQAVAALLPSYSAAGLCGPLCNTAACQMSSEVLTCTNMSHCSRRMPYANGGRHWCY